MKTLFLTLFLIAAQQSLAGFSNPTASNDATTIFYSYTYTGTPKYLRMLFDTDRNTKTGEFKYGVGSEYLIENGSLYKYSTTTRRWNRINSSNMTKPSPGLVQWKVLRSDLLGNPSVMHVVLQMSPPVEASAVLTHTLTETTPLPPVTTTTTTTTTTTSVPTMAPLTITAAPIVSSLTTTSAQISWSLNRGATGQVQYGLTATYGSSSVLENTYNYSSHSQTLSGLTPGTLYHFRVISKDQFGQTVVSGDQTFTTVSITIPPTTTTTTLPSPPVTGSYPPDTRLSPLNPPPLALPSYLAPILEPTFKTKMTRVTDPSAFAGRYLQHNYSKTSAWNRDGSLMIIQNYLLDGKTYRVSNSTMPPASIDGHTLILEKFLKSIALEALIPSTSIQESKQDFANFPNMRL